MGSEKWEEGVNYGMKEKDVGRRTQLPLHGF